MRLILSVILFAFSCVAAQAQQLRVPSLQPVSDLPEIAADTTAVGEASGNTNPNIIFVEYELPPVFPGGTPALMRWINSNLRYPEAARKNKIQGRVIVKFTIEKDGTVVDPKVVRSVDPDLDSEALRLIRSMPKWEPGKFDGVPWTTYFNLPINFKLE
ncbi:MAG: energy transducer TonB [Muribaculaceae bacterium]|nr:energy transducer TonB [Muribaculaceae bacterium]